MKKGKRNATEGIHFFFLMKNIERNIVHKECVSALNQREKGMLS